MYKIKIILLTLLLVGVPFLPKHISYSLRVYGSQSSFPAIWVNILSLFFLISFLFFIFSFKSKKVHVRKISKIMFLFTTGSMILGILNSRMIFSMLEGKYFFATLITTLIIVSIITIIFLHLFLKSIKGLQNNLFKITLVAFYIFSIHMFIITYTPCISGCGGNIVKQAEIPTMVVAQDLEGTSTLDNTPRIMYWSGKVNQYVSLSKSEWETDPDGISGSDIDKLEYCKKIYPNTIKVQEYKMETIGTWRSQGNMGEYSSTKQSYECVQG